MAANSHAIIIPDNFTAFPPKSFCIPSFYEEDVESVIIPEGMIRDRIKGLAREIFDLYAKPSKDPDPLVLVCVLKSSFRFFCALQQEIEDLNVESCRSVNKATGQFCGLSNGTTSKSTDQKRNRSLPVLCEFIRVRSYINMSTKGNAVEIQGILSPEAAFTDKNILIVEDIIDTGRTMEALVHNLREYKPKSVKVASMLWKRLHLTGKTCAFVPDFFGFEIPDQFVIGFGMDYNERYRDLNHLCIISKIGIEKYRAS